MVKNITLGLGIAGLILKGVLLKDWMDLGFALILAIAWLTGR